MEAFYWHFPEVPVHGSLENKLGRQMTISSCLFIVLRLLGFLSWQAFKRRTGTERNLSYSEIVGGSYLEEFSKARSHPPPPLLKEGTESYGSLFINLSIWNQSTEIIICE